MKQSKTVEATEAPKRPLNAMMKFRNQKFEQYKDDPNKVQLVKDAWKNIDPKLREQMDAEYQEEMKKWRTKMDAWKGKHGE